MATERRGLLLRYAVLASLLVVLVALLPVRRMLVALLSEDYTQAQSGAPMRPASGGQRPQIALTLERVAEGLPQPTDIQFPPGIDDMAVVLSKTGIAHWVALDSGLHGRLLEVEVVTASEEGLLGLAFHPGYRENGRIFLNYVAASRGHDKTLVEEWKLDPPDDLRRAQATRVRVLLRVDQPYQNHNAGQLAFGPDGMLYVGFGDGGFRDDPHGHGQDPSGVLGSMLRIDVGGGAGGAGGSAKPYTVPKDNPFVGKEGFAPETWAYGLRNPWRYSFDPKGRLIVADVGQDLHEEVDIVSAGDNLGWVIREGFACHAKEPSACERSDLVDPVLDYGRDLGSSITGGFVYTGSRVPALRGLYVFGDFVSGRLFAMKLPDDRRQRVDKAIPLGKWPLFPSTFGRDARGELYVASFAAGEIFRFGPGPGVRQQPKPNSP